MKSKKMNLSSTSILLLSILCFGLSCSGNDDPPVTNTEILLVSTNPQENSIISVKTESANFVFNQNIYLVDKAKITLNGAPVANASTTGASLKITFNFLESDTEYELVVLPKAIRDGSMNLSDKPFSLKFKTEKVEVVAETIRIEAENAVFSGGGTNPAQIANDANCSGGKYVNTRESNLKFSFAIAKAGHYKIVAKAKSSDGDKVNTFRFDGEHNIDISFHKNNTFEEFIVADPYYFTAGNHTIEMVKNWGWIQLDYLEISPSTTVSVEFDIQPLVTPQPSANTAKLFQFLRDNFQKKIISGVMTARGLSVTTGNEQNEVSWIFQKTGKKPALIGLDFIDYTNVPESWRHNPDLIKDVITWKNSNGIVALCWHWRDPSLKTYEFYTNKTNFDARKIFDTQSDDYAAMMRDMDIIAGLLKDLRDKDIPILWRPLHEASGGWFWWGAQGPEACKKIWQIMFEKFTNEHKLNNLIWVWTSEANSNALNWYPGDDCVDIIGLDIYNEGDHGSQMLAFEELKRVYRGKKMLALSECGSLPAMAAMKRDRSIWSYYMPWNGEMTKDPKWNTVNDWNTSLSDPDVISLDDMPANFY